MIAFVLRIIREKPLGAAGAAICLLFLLCGIFAAWLAPYGFNEINPVNRMKAPSFAFPLGTDYTQALLAAVPIPDPVLEAARPQQVIAGEVPSVLNPPPGCRFHPRCPLAEARCAVEEPQLRQTPSGRSIACHRVAI